MRSSVSVVDAEDVLRVTEQRGRGIFVEFGSFDDTSAGVYGQEIAFANGEEAAYQGFRSSGWHRIDGRHLWSGVDKHS